MKKKAKRKVDCKKIEKRIPLYLADKLSVYETLGFLNHISECPSCKEELTIQYMVSEGIDKAEKYNEYNLLGGLQEKIALSYGRIKKHDIMYFLSTIFVFAAIGLFVAAVIFIAF